jgi:hypothetical protein
MSSSSFTRHRKRQFGGNGKPLKMPFPNKSGPANALLRDSQYQFELQHCRTDGKRREFQRAMANAFPSLWLKHKTHPHTLSKPLYIHNTIASCRMTVNRTQETSKTSKASKSLSVSRIRYDAHKILNGGCSRNWLRSEQLCTTVRDRCGYWLMAQFSNNDCCSLFSCFSLEKRPFSRSRRPLRWERSFKPMRNERECKCLPFVSFLTETVSRKIRHQKC